MSVLNDQINNADNFITKVFDTLDDTVFDLLDPIKDFAVVLAGIGVIIYLAKILMPIIERGESIDIYPLIRPICIGLVVTQFSVVTSLLDGTLSGISNGIKTTYEEEKVETINFEEAKERGKKKLEAEKSENTKKKTLLGKLKTIIFEGPKGYFQQEIGEIIIYLKYDLLFPLLAWLAEFIGGIAYVIINLMSRFYILFLAIIGPVSLALSQFSPFQGSFGDWMSRYISVGLWPAMANMLRFMNNFVIVKMNTSFGDSFDAALVMFFMLIMISYFYLQIPEVSEYIVSGGGVGSLNRSMYDNAKGVATGTTAAAAGAGAGFMRGLKRGVYTNKFEKGLDEKLTKAGERTGTNGRISRATQKLGNKVGRTTRSIIDNAKSIYNGNFSKEERATYKETLAQKRFDKAQKFSEKNDLPKKKDLRKEAKNLMSMKSRGLRLTPHQEEIVSRYKAGRYQGSGKFELSNTERREQESMEFRSFLFKGFERGAEFEQRKGAFNPKDFGGWHPPLTPTKRQSRLINKK